MVELDRDCCRCGLPPFTKEVVKREYIRSVDFDVDFRVIHSGFAIFDNSDFYKEKVAKKENHTAIALAV